jgi:NAD(P)H-nitrite reductase large subunit
MAKNFPYSYEVCSCKKVTLGEIIYAIEQKDAKTLEDIAMHTDAGTACGCCKSAKDDFGNPKMKLYLTQILQKFAR